MPYRHKIRLRIFLTYPILGLLIGIFMLLFLKISFQYLEREFMDTYLMDELEHFIKQAEQDPNLTVLRSKNWVIFKGDANNPNPDMEFLFRYRYTEGIHEVEYNQHGYDVAIKMHNQVRYTLIYDDTGFEAMKHTLVIYLVAAVIIILLLATWYGLWFSKKVIEPVTSLASRIKKLNPEKTTSYLSDDYTDDEVGMLALEFDAYSRRLQALVQREREFTGNASHELRTPLAVIMATSEGLLSKQEISHDVVQRVERINRSAKEMAERLDTLLTLARNPAADGESVNKTDLLAIVEQLIDDHGGLLSPRVKVVKKIQGHPDSKAPSPIVSMLMGNLIKNAFSYTKNGTVTVFLSEHEFSVADTGPGMDQIELERVFERGYRGLSSRGSGVGLALSKRICEYYGWRLTIESSKNRGTTVRWLF